MIEIDSKYAEHNKSGDNDLKSEHPPPFVRGTPPILTGYSAFFRTIIWRDFIWRFGDESRPTSHAATRREWE